MKTLFLISFLILTGCQTSGAALRGMGQGLQNSSQNYQYKPPQQRFCTHQVSGNQVQSYCY